MRVPLNKRGYIGSAKLREFQRFGAKPFAQELVDKPYPGSNSLR